MASEKKSVISVKLKILAEKKQGKIFTMHMNYLMSR